MAVAFRSTNGILATEFAGTASPVVNKPSAAADGDLMLMCVVTATTTDMADSCAGWTQVASEVATGSSDSTVGLYWRIHSGDSTSWTMTNLFNSTEDGGAVVICYTGVHQTSPIHKYAGGTQGSSGPSLTTTLPACMIVQFNGCDPGTSGYSGTADADPAATERHDAKIGSNSYAYVYIQEYLQSTAGECTLTPSVTSDNYGCYEVALTDANHGLVSAVVSTATGAVNVPAIGLSANIGGTIAAASASVITTNASIAVGLYPLVSDADAAVPEHTATVSAGAATVTQTEPIAATAAIPTPGLSVTAAIDAVVAAATSLALAASVTVAVTLGAATAAASGAVPEHAVTGVLAPTVQAEAATASGAVPTPELSVTGSVQAQPATATAAAPYSLQHGLTHAWTFNETSGTRRDSVGSTHLSDNGSVGYNTGIDGNAAEFTDQAAEWLEAASSPLPSGDLTMAMWVRFLSGGNDPKFFAMQYAGASDDCFHFSVSSNYVYLSIYDPDGTEEATTGIELPYSEWHLVGWQYDSAAKKGRTFIDTTFDGWSPALVVGMNVASAEPFVFSSNQGDYGALGRIDTPTIWNRLLTTAEISDLAAQKVWPFGPTVSGIVIVSGEVATASAAIPVPGVAGVLAPTVSGEVAAGTASIPEHSVSATRAAEVQPPLITATAELLQHTALGTGQAEVLPPVVTATAEVITASIAVALYADRATASAAVLEAAAAAGTGVTAELAAATAEVPTHSVFGAVTASVSGEVAAASASIPEHQATGGGAIEAVVAAATAQVLTPDVTISGSAEAQVVTATASIPTPDVSVAPAVSGSVATATAQIPTHDVAGSGINAPVVTATAEVIYIDASIAVELRPTIATATGAALVAGVEAVTLPVVDAVTATATAQVLVPAWVGELTVYPDPVTASAEVVTDAEAHIAPSVAVDTKAGATGDVLAPGVSGGAVAVTQTAVIEATAAVLIPTVSAIAGVDAVAATATASIPGHTVTASATVTAEVAVATAAIPVPAIGAGATVQPSQATATAEVLTASASSAVAAEPSAATAIAQVLTPDLLLSQNLSAVQATAAAAIPVHGVSGPAPPRLGVPVFVFMTMPWTRQGSSNAWRRSFMTMPWSRAWS